MKKDIEFILKSHGYREECPERYGHIFYNPERHIRITLYNTGNISIGYSKDFRYRAFSKYFHKFYSWNE